MKLTWFGGETFRLYLGGKIVLVRNGPLPPGIDVTEAGAGADQQIDLSASSLAPFSPDRLTRAPTRLIDQTPAPDLRISAFADGVCLIAPDEPTVFIAPAETAEWGRFADNAVIVLTGVDLAPKARTILTTARPKLLALAVPKITDADFTAIAAAAGQSAVQLLEFRMALEA